MSKYLDKVNLDIKLMDSRGESISVGDLVIHPNGSIYRIGVSVNGIFSKYMDTTSRGSLPKLLIKVNKKNLIPFKDFILNSGLEEKYISDYLKVGLDYTNLSTLFYGSFKNQYRHNNGSLRGFETKDYLGRNLKPGDLVVYINEKGYCKYGVMISSTKLFNEDNFIERVYFVVKIDDYTDKENILYQTLSQNYRLASLKKSDESRLNRGDIYTYGKNIYMYLGHFVLDVEQPNKANTVCNLSYDINQDYWIKLPHYLVGKTPDLDFILKAFNDSIKSSFTCSKKMIDVSDKLYYVYYSLDDFKNITTKISSNAMQTNHMDLPDEILVQDTFVKYFGDFKYKFKFI